MKNVHLKLPLAAMAASMGLACAAQTIDNWRSSDGTVWRNSTDLCWRDAGWTPATAAPGCDGAIVAKVKELAPYVPPLVLPAPPAKVAPAPAPVAQPMPVAQPAPAAPAKPVISRFTVSADALFDVDKSVIKPAGKARLDELAAKLPGVQVQSIIVIGHTDSTASDAYNDKLSLRRAQAVKAYLVSKGVSQSLISVEGHGERHPVATNATSAGRAQNRRVEVKVEASRAQ